MRSFVSQKNAGFTLVELMVVVGVIAMLLSIVLAAIGVARENSREKERVADLAEIEFALTLYKEVNRSYPAFPNGVQIAAGGALDAQIRGFMGSAPTDPTGGGTYGYWYDSNFTCAESGQKVIFARTMEQQKNGNFNEVCTSSSADTTLAGTRSYVVVLSE